MCYGIKRIPKGSWYCRPCAVGQSPKCSLCPNRGGAMKSNRSCDRWLHVSCALWVPEIEFENKETMEPAINFTKIPKLSDSLKPIYRKTARDIRIIFALLKRHCNLLSFAVFSSV
uniref:PHD-type domain-containing protein n=1 Tax=Romanomermis culicivorax TaxID=13658 RepID=A0A915L9U4_ROMCU